MSAKDPIIELTTKHLFPTGNARNQMRQLGVSLVELLRMLQTSPTAIRTVGVKHKFYENPIDMTIDEINGKLIIVIHHKLWLTLEEEPFVSVFYVDEADDVEKERFYANKKKQR